MARASDEAYGLACDLSRSTRYHKAREAFFQGWASTFSFTSLIAGSSVVVGLLAHAPAWVGIAAGATVAIIQAAELALRVSDKARLHAGLAAEFQALERAMVISGDPSPARVRELEAEKLVIESREPPIKRYLDLVCHNEVARAIGSTDVDRVSFWQRRLRHYLSGAPA